MSKLIYPPPLSRGDKVVIISPSGNTESYYIDTAKDILESWGLQVHTTLHAYQKYGRYGGSIRQRMDDLQSSMDDKDIKMIFCSRGGYGIVQLLEQIYYNGIRKHPKWLVGYSDITALHSAFLKNGIVSLHAPMARHLTEHPDDEASEYLRKILFSRSMDYKVQSHLFNRNGEIRGRLFGGNLAVMCGLIGTPYFRIPTRGVLFIEDIGEPPYKIDRMIWQLKLSGVLKNISGLIVGQFSECEEDPLMEKTICESVRDIVSEYDYPVVFDFPVGHGVRNYPMIHGGRVHLSVKDDFVTLENID